MSSDQEVPPFIKRIEGIGKSYFGPVIDPDQVIPPTKNELTPDRLTRTFVDSAGNQYDKFYNPIEQADASAAGRCPPFPDSSEYSTFSEFQDAVFEWEKRVLDVLGESKVLPVVEGQSLPFPISTNTSTGDDISTTERRTEVDDATEISEYSSATSTVGGSKIRSRDFSVAELSSAVRMNSRSNKVVSQLLASKLQEEKDKKLSKDLYPEPPWDSQLIPMLPDSSQYRTYGQYERAMNRWARVTMRVIDDANIPLHPRQLKNQIKMLPTNKTDIHTERRARIYQALRRRISPPKETVDTKEIRRRLRLFNSVFGHKMYPEDDFYFVTRETMEKFQGSNIETTAHYLDLSISWKPPIVEEWTYRGSISAKHKRKLCNTIVESIPKAASVPVSRSTGCTAPVVTQWRGDQRAVFRSDFDRVMSFFTESRSPLKIKDQVRFLIEIIRAVKSSDDVTLGKFISALLEPSFSLEGIEIALLAPSKTQGSLMNIEVLAPKIAGPEPFLELVEGLFENYQHPTHRMKVSLFVRLILQTKYGAVLLGKVVPDTLRIDRIPFLVNLIRCILLPTGSRMPDSAEVFSNINFVPVVESIRQKYLMSLIVSTVYEYLFEHLLLKAKENPNSVKLGNYVYDHIGNFIYVCSEKISSLLKENNNTDERRGRVYHKLGNLIGMNSRIKSELGVFALRRLLTTNSWTVRTEVMRDPSEISSKILALIGSKNTLVMKNTRRILDVLKDWDQRSWFAEYMLNQKLELYTYLFPPTKARYSLVQASRASSFQNTEKYHQYLDSIELNSDLSGLQRTATMGMFSKESLIEVDSASNSITSFRGISSRELVTDFLLWFLSKEPDASDVDHYLKVGGIVLKEQFYRKLFNYLRQNMGKHSEWWELVPARLFLALVNRLVSLNMFCGEEIADGVSAAKARKKHKSWFKTKKRTQITKSFSQPEMMNGQTEKIVVELKDSYNLLSICTNQLEEHPRTRTLILQVFGKFVTLKSVRLIVKRDSFVWEKLRILAGSGVLSIVEMAWEIIYTLLSKEDGVVGFLESSGALSMIFEVTRGKQNSRLEYVSLKYLYKILRMYEKEKLVYKNTGKLKYRSVPSGSAKEALKTVKMDHQIIIRRFERDSVHLRLHSLVEKYDKTGGAGLRYLVKIYHLLSTSKSLERLRKLYQKNDDYGMDFLIMGKYV